MALLWELAGEAQSLAERRIKEADNTLKVANEARAQALHARAYCDGLNETSLSSENHEVIEARIEMHCVQLKFCVPVNRVVC